MYLAGLYFEPRESLRGRSSSEDELFAGEYNDVVDGSPLDEPRRQAKGIGLCSEGEVTTNASTGHSSSSSSATAEAISQGEVPPVPPRAAAAAFINRSEASALSTLALSRSVWRLCRRLLLPGETGAFECAAADSRVLIDWVSSLQKREESRRGVKSAGPKHVEKVIAAALVIVQRAHQINQTPIAVPGVASMKEESVTSCCNARRAFLWRSSGKFPDPLGLTSLVSRATHKAVELLSSGYEEEGSSGGDSGRHATATPGLQNSDVKFRDCSAVFQVIVSFCQALVAGSVWLDEAAPISTSTVSEFLTEAANSLRSARICTPEQPHSLWNGAAKFKQRLSNFRPAPPPCSLCVTAICTNPLNELYTFEQSLCQFLSILNYETRISENDALGLYF